MDRMQQNLGVPWKSSSSDVFLAGNPEAAVTGIVTSWTPSLEVLRKAAASGRNLIIARESPFWLHETASPEFSGSGAAPKREQFTSDATYQFKQDFLTKNKLIVLRFSDNWNARKEDGQMKALTAALNWDRYRTASGRGHSTFSIPASSLDALVRGIQGRLKLKAVRVLGDPKAQVSKIALTHGFLLVPALEEALKEPGIDVVVTGEPVEWEAHPYFDDWITAGFGKGMVMLGSEGSEEPGSREVAAWLKSFIKEVPVEWIPAGEPFWTAK